MGPSLFGQGFLSDLHDTKSFSDIKEKAGSSWGKRDLEGVTTWP